MYKSINRFYAWGYAKWLEDEKGYTKDDLLNSPMPLYEQGKTVKRQKGKNGMPFGNLRRNEQQILTERQCIRSLEKQCMTC